MLRPRRNSPWGHVSTEPPPDASEHEAIGIAEAIRLPIEFTPALAESLRLAEDFE